MISEEQIQAVVRRIVEGYAPDKIILFGSYAYGVPHEHSDLDLLIIKEKAEAKRAERAIKVWRLLWDDEFPAMDILIRTPAEMEKAAGIFQSVETIAETQGRLLYAA
ncbi:MAG TPA: nucleotidyltransferase domain-containing protein [Hymenobacter sp.]|uniref:nucleotidyltransferase domain-containing protein n=1 Tax=Hymenobacter sp. TaxID=1898978 RepID=UPI002D7E73E1|nr:nucleotidyltransferase domain-containing protein [Hymenobacter sp.]HET9504739.1 nucleotidyltransferase domain-containing protein [Hymenobacter sp.]